MLHQRLSLIFLLTTLAACAPIGKEAAIQIAEETSSSVACKAADSHFFNHLYALPLESKEFPHPSVMEESLREELEREYELGRLKTNDKNKIDAFVMHYMKLYQLVTVKTVEELDLKSSDEVIAALSALEMGDRTSDKKARLQAEWEALKGPLLLAAEELEGSCDENSGENEVVDPPKDEESIPAPPEEFVEASLMEYLESNYTPQVFGAMKTVAVAYQSCEVLNLSAMDKNSPSVVGIEVYGRHSNGSGNLRRVASLSDVTRTHYYIKNQVHPSNTCANLKSNPLIYDYGGKPSASSSMSSELNIFKNAGTGSAELGIDCSGYVFTAYATAGLKMRSDQPLKAIQVFGISAGMMKEPQSNGLNCLSKVYGDLKPGDLIASSGHIVMVDEVGDDPFGISHINNKADCKVSNMSPDRYDFVISQSSPSKGAIGINRMEASAYFPSAASSMREGLKYYAVSACMKKFNTSQSPGTSQVSVVRHKGTASCKSTAVKLAKQDCLSSCRVSISKMD